MVLLNIYVWGSVSCLSFKSIFPSYEFCTQLYQWVLDIVTRLSIQVIMVKLPQTSTLAQNSF